MRMQESEAKGNYGNKETVTEGKASWKQDKSQWKERRQ